MEKIEKYFIMNSMSYSPEAYSKGGIHEGWGKEDKKYYPEYGHKLYKVLKENSLLPENLEGFVFLSVSANQGIKERDFAESLFEDIKDQHFNKKPFLRLKILFQIIL